MRWLILQISYAFYVLQWKIEGFVHKFNCRVFGHRRSDIAAFWERKEGIGKTLIRYHTCCGQRVES